MSFYNEIQKYNWNTIGEQIYAKTPADVQQALQKDAINISDFQALISPAASPFLEDMVKKSISITQKRFGKTMQLYIPLYLSNSCTNACVYCGFNHTNSFDRKILTLEEVRAEALEIKNMGFEHILLVAGEDNTRCGVAYMNKMMEELQDIFSLISIEIQPMETEEYMQLKQHGLHAVYIYQETYNQENYKNYHPTGKKSNYRYRLETPDRLGKAGIHKIGLGCLLGLEDWRIDSFFTALHLQYLERQYWQTKYAISFPRLRPHAGVFTSKHSTSQRDLVQLMCAYRLLNEQVEISITTREDAKFRDNILSFGATSYSAGSKTNPGGYAADNESLEQFSVHDDRSVVEITNMIRNKGYQVIWKDWDSFMQL